MGVNPPKYTNARAHRGGVAFYKILACARGFRIWTRHVGAAFRLALLHFDRSSRRYVGEGDLFPLILREVHPRAMTSRRGGVDILPYDPAAAITLGLRGVYVSPSMDSQARRVG